MAFTITTLGTAATVVGTAASDSIAAAQLLNIAQLQLNAYEADDIVITGSTALTAGNIGLGQGADQLTYSANVTNVTSTLGDGADAFTGSVNMTTSTLKGGGGADTFNISGGLLTSAFANGNEGADRYNLTGSVALANTTLVGGSQDDLFVVNTTGTFNDGRLNGQNGNDTITVNDIGAGSTTTMYGGAGSDRLDASGIGGGQETSRVVRFSGDNGNDTLIGARQGADIAGDRLFGGNDNDQITGGGGADTLSGGEGIDTFVFTGNNAITMTVEINGGAVIAAGNTIRLGDGLTPEFNRNIAVITDFATGDRIDTANGTAAVSGLGASNNLTQIGGTGTTYYLSGSYNSVNSTFTVSDNAKGLDTLLVLNGGSSAQFVLLQGTNSAALGSGTFF